MLFLVLALLLVYPVAYHVMNSKLKTRFEKVVPKQLDEGTRIYSPKSTRPSVGIARDLPKALQKFLNSSLPPFLQDYKNPCWYTGTRLNCLPYFNQVGVTKCGTSALCAQIRKHPQIVPVNKENHWIARGQFRGSALAPLSMYLDIFKNGTKEVQRSVVSGFHPKVFGDCTPSTIWENFYHRLVPKSMSSVILQEPIFTNAEYIYHLNPATKIVVTIRNPVDRLFSGYMFFKRSSYSLEGFDKYARDLVTQHRMCLQTSSLRACVYKPFAWLSGRIRLGIYHIQIKDFFDVFPRNQIMVSKLEDFSNNMAYTMSEVYSFLDLDPMSDTELKASVEKKSETPKKKKRTRPNIGTMWNSTRQILYDFYKPYNEELVKLLGPKFDYN